MDTILTKDQFPLALERIERWNQGGKSYLMERSLKEEQNGGNVFEFAVDRWPDFSIMMLMPIKDSVPSSLEHFINFVVDEETSTEADVKEKLLKMKPGGFKTISFLNNYSKYKSILKEDFQAWNMPAMLSITLETLVASEKSVKTFTLPDGYIVDELQESDAELVTSHWEFANENSFPFVHYNIKNFPNVAVRSKEDGSLVAWEITYFMGAMGILYVMENHRGRGLAKFVIYELVKKLGREGHDAYCWIEESNKASIGLHLKCGFSTVNRCYFTKLKGSSKEGEADE